VSFALILTILAFIVKGLVVWKLNQGKKIKHIPFIPIILLAFLGAWALI
jgi:prepilin signal peptidase PulO-like enzyme (type II secretory pathway)